MEVRNKPKGAKEKANLCPTLGNLPWHVLGKIHMPRITDLWPFFMLLQGLHYASCFFKLECASEV